MMQTSLSESAIAEANRLSLEAICQDDETVQSRLLAEARSVLDNALGSEPNNPNLHHMLGLCWYDDPERSDKIRQAIEFHFKTAKQLAPSAPFPSLYLGHFYFDEGRYLEALPLFQQVDESYFEDIGQMPACREISPPGFTFPAPAASIPRSLRISRAPCRRLAR